MNLKVFLSTLVFFTIATTSFAQQPSGAVSKKEIGAWVEKKEWANGLSLSPHSSVNKDSFYTAYHTNKKLWDKAFAYLKGQDLQNLPPGKYPIDGEAVFAIVTEGPSKNKEDAKWESHRQYIDLHYIIKGKEMIGVADAATAKVTKPYTIDVINYDADGKYYTSDPATFFLFFTNDAHRPGIMIDKPDTVKKIVIKIQVAPAG